MFPVVPNLTFPVRAAYSPHILVRRAAAHMQNRRRWDVEDPVVHFPHPPAKIGVLEIHEKPFVESARLAKHLPPHHQRRTGNPVHLPVGVVAPLENLRVLTTVVAEPAM